MSRDKTSKWASNKTLLNDNFILAESDEPVSFAEEIKMQTEWRNADWSKLDERGFAE